MNSGHARVQRPRQKLSLMQYISRDSAAQPSENDDGQGSVVSNMTEVERRNIMACFHMEIERLRKKNARLEQKLKNNQIEKDAARQEVLEAAQRSAEQRIEILRLKEENAGLVRRVKELELEVSSVNGVEPKTFELEERLQTLNILEKSAGRNLAFRENKSVKDYYVQKDQVESFSLDEKPKPDSDKRISMRFGLLDRAGKQVDRLLSSRKLIDSNGTEQREVLNREQSNGDINVKESNFGSPGQSPSFDRPSSRALQQWIAKSKSSNSSNRALDFHASLRSEDSPVSVRAFF